MSRPVLQVVIASTRPGRVGPTVADWFIQLAKDHGAFEVEVTDLAELDLPFMDEPNHPRLQQYVHEHTKNWSATVTRSDAFVFVHPEYNYGFNAPLKNAFDYLHVEWSKKPISFVSYGGISGGLRAVQMLKQIVTTVGMMPAAASVPIPWVAKSITDGKFEPNDIMISGANAMLDELFELHGALSPLRKS